jgi:16S rRNA (uracil1498-N3)-methyltransferase
MRGDELRHLRVRRIRPGAKLILIDGCGGEAAGTVIRISDSEALIDIDGNAGELHAQRESPLALTLAQAVLKSDKIDLVVQKATELGVHEIVLHISERCVLKPSAERLHRWDKIARTAAKQSQRIHIPRITGPVALDTVLHAARPGLRLLFWEGAPGAVRWPDGPADAAVVVIGPEGGFAEHEVDAARAAGFCIVGLGPRILRAETAAIAALALCQQRWGDLASEI